MSDGISQALVCHQIQFTFFTQHRDGLTISCHLISTIELREWPQTHHVVCIGPLPILYLSDPAVHGSAVAWTRLLNIPRPNHPPPRIMHFSSAPVDESHWERRLLGFEEQNTFLDGHLAG